MCPQDESLRRRRGIPCAEEEEAQKATAKIAKIAKIAEEEEGEEEDSKYRLTRKVVAHHNSPNDAWVIHNGSVYDITMFLESHPGGSEILYEHLGSDVTGIMNGSTGNNDEKKYYHEHSPFAYKLLEKHRIGKVIDVTQNEKAVIDGNIDEENGEELVNWNKPILHQVGKLGKKYNKWIHSFPTSDHTVKMFTNNTIESMTKCAWYVPLVFWIPIIILESVHYVYLMNGVTNLNVMGILVDFITGIMCWLFFEYSLHRWVFHWKSKSYFGNIIHFLIHGHHHITPMDFDRLVFPPVPALILGAPFWYGAPLLVGIEHGYPWLVGFAAGYLMYDMTHFWIHHGIPSNKLLRQQKRRHVHHHYFQPSVNFGISNPLFDYVFGTIKEPAN